MKNSNDYSRFDNIADPDEESYFEQANQCKKEGNEAFKDKRFDAAASLYRGGIDKLNSQIKTADDKSSSVSSEETRLRVDLHCNRCAAYLKLKKYTRASEEATEALKLDATHAKSLYRRAQAHKFRGKDKDAMRDVMTMLQTDSTSKPGLKMKAALVRKLHPRTVRAIEDEISKKRADAERKRVDAARKAARKKSPQANTQAKPAAASAATRRETGARPKLDADAMRGYKKTKDGRTTTFFHRELDLAGKKLVGSSTPTKIEGVHAAPTLDRKVSPASAWNTAGTVEEKDKTAWAKDRLRCLLGSLQAGELQGDGFTARVTAVDDLEGDASHVFMRGRMRYLFEFGFSLSWKASVRAVDKEAIVKGTAKYVEVCNDTEAGEFCPKIEMSGSPSKAAETEARRAVKALQKQVEKAVAQFSRDFQDQ